MRVLMISADRTLVGQAQAGDTIKRHQAYANAAGSLDIIVFSKESKSPMSLSEKLKVFPTGSSKISHGKAAVKLGKELASKYKYDLLVTQDLAVPAGAKLKKLFGLPWIVSIHGMFWDKSLTGYNLLQKFLGWLIKRNLKYADGFRVNNKFTEDQLKVWHLKQPVLVQPTAIDVSSFFVERNFGKPVSKILFVGRLTKEKNLPMLIRAFKNLGGSVELNIIGEGSEHKALEELGKDDKRIHFLGSKTINELPVFFEAADIFVLPSDTETFGQVLLQASAAGCAIVATKTVGAVNIVKDGRSGLLVPVGDKEALIKALKRLITDTGLRTSLSKTAQLEAKKYDSEEAVNKLVEFWEKVASV